MNDQPERRYLPCVLRYAAAFSKKLEVHKVYTTARARIRTLYRQQPIMNRMDMLLPTAVGKQLRRSEIGGIVEVAA